MKNDEYILYKYAHIPNDNQKEVMIECFPRVQGNVLSQRKLAFEKEVRMDIANLSTTTDPWDIMSTHLKWLNNMENAIKVDKELAAHQLGAWIKNLLHGWDLDKEKFQLSKDVGLLYKYQIT